MERRLRHGGSSRASGFGLDDRSSQNRFFWSRDGSRQHWNLRSGCGWKPAEELPHHTETGTVRGGDLEIARGHEFSGNLVNQVANLDAGNGFGGENGEPIAAQIRFQRGAEHAGHGHETQAGLSGGVTPGEFKRRLGCKAFRIGGVRFAQSVRRSDARDLMHSTERTAGE